MNSPRQSTSLSAARLLRRARQFQLIQRRGQQVVESEAAEPTTHEGEIRILLIEDDDSVRDAIIASLEELGLGEVSIAVDGQSGLELIESLQPEVVLLDLMLPVTDGFDVLAQLRKRPTGFQPDRIVVISAMSDALSNDALLQLGASYVLRKPFSLAEIEKAIKG